MRTLFLDLASHQGTIAAVDGDRLLASVAVDHRVSDRELVPLYRTVLQEAGWSQQQMERIACVIGPGGFTSLRVAVAFANALAYALHVPVAGIHLSDLHAARVAGDQSFLWLHSTKKSELFVRGFGSLHTQFPEPAWMQLEAFLQAMPEGVRWVGELIPDHEIAVRQKAGEQVAEEPLERILPSFLSSQTYVQETLLPWYGRKW